MNLFDKQVEVYLPLLENFCNANIENYYTMWKPGTIQDVSGLHVPFCSKEYGSGKKTIFLGQDTYKADTYLEYLFDCSKESKYEDYLRFNNNWAENANQSLHYGGNYPYKFWNFVARIQFALNHKELKDSMMESLNEVPLEVLSFGWGNVYPLEMLETVGKKIIKKKTVLDYIKKDLYLELFNAAKEISKLKYLLQAYDPDYIIILAWKDEIEKDLFDGLNVHWNEDEYIDKVISTYSIENSKTKVIWLNHPRAMPAKSISIKYIIDLIINRM